MGGFDLIIGAIILISIIVGVMRGFVREALSITSWIMAIWLGITFCEPAGDFVSQFFSIPADGFRTAAGFALVFICTLFAFALLTYAITKLIVRGAIKGTDRVLGAGFGLVRGIAIVVALFLVARGMGMENSDWWKNSKYIHHFESAANYAETLLPSQLQSSGEASSELHESPIIESEIDPQTESGS